METCANPGCVLPGTSKCGACKMSPYCGPICQTADWSRHKEECPGQLRKVGMANLEKAKGYDRERNFVQSLRYAELAATKLEQLNDRSLLPDHSEAMRIQFIANKCMGKKKEALQCAEEWHCLWHHTPEHPLAVQAAFALIEICMQNNKYLDAERYAHTLWEIINLHDQLQPYIADGAYYLALSTLRLDEVGGISTEKKQEAGQEAIVLARRALEIHTHLHGIESDKGAAGMLLLADLLSYFNEVVDDDGEIPRLYDQAKSTFARVQGTALSSNIAACEGNLGRIYDRRAKKAMLTNNLDRCVANLELALPRFRETSRILRAINRVDQAVAAAHDAFQVEEMLRLVAIARTTPGASAGATFSPHASSSSGSSSSSSSSSSRSSSSSS